MAQRNQRRQNGTVVSETDRAWLRGVVEEVGLDAAARQVGISRLAAASTLAALPQHFGTHVAISAARAGAVAA